MTEPVLNQSIELPPFDAYASDPALVAVVEAYEGGWVAEQASALGRLVGTPEIAEHARLANTHTPDLRTFDRFGHRIDEVEFHPSWHYLMALGRAHEVHAVDWTREGTPGAVIGRCALTYVYAQAEQGVQCPLTMTHAAIPALRQAPELAEQWEPRLISPEYEPQLAPVADKTSATFGMAMTEKQGGSDVRANTTRAVAAGGGEVRLYGHKWFCSAPMCDGFLTLAQAPEGLGCYLVPRILEDGTRNPFAIQRLKDKLGNRSNASSEIEYHDTVAYPVGDPARGVATIIEMVEQTRLDICINSAALMRQAVRYAVHHAHHRAAFGRRLVEHPLMRNVLADLVVETEAAIALAFRVARAFDRRGAEESEAGLARVATPIAKYFLSKQLVGVTFEALECHGGNGYVEDWPLARIYREAPLGSVWEGAGNVQCLDVLRAMHRSPDAREALMMELDRFQGGDPRLDRALQAVKDELDGDPATIEFRARRLAERLARVLQAGLLFETAPSAVAEAFASSRLDDRGVQYGTLSDGVDVDAILERSAVG